MRVAIKFQAPWFDAQVAPQNRTQNSVAGNGAFLTILEMRFLSS